MGGGAGCGVSSCFTPFPFRAIASALLGSVPATCTASSSPQYPSSQTVTSSPISIARHRMAAHLAWGAGEGRARARVRAQARTQARAREAARGA